MENKYLMIMEVSQKQSYIFNEKKLKNNILASDTIAYVTSSEFFEKQFADCYNKDDNMVYSGGGHTYLIFDSRDQARTFAKKVSAYVIREFVGLELFIKIMPHLPDENADEAEREAFRKMGPVARIKKLTDELEKKKGRREASFFQTTFGVENSGRRRSVSDGDSDGNMEKMRDTVRDEVNKASKLMATRCKKDSDPVDVENLPAGYEEAKQFSELIGGDSRKNFIAVIHIDGNQMGNRVTALAKCIEDDTLEIKDKYNGLSKERQEFEIWREYSRTFSDSIDYDFKKALELVYEDVKESLEDDEHGIGCEFFKDGETKKKFPLRRIITAGDDICFVTDGRIGLECAARFIEHLEKQENEVDKKNYHACAGVAIVHQKYPFYRAYDMAEQLCANAKKVMMEKRNAYVKAEAEALEKKGMDPEKAKKDAEDKIPVGSLSAIDWHIEYGEMVGSLDDIREKMVTIEGKKPMFARPYQISDAAQVHHLEAADNGTEYGYYDFRRLLLSLLCVSDKSDRSDAGKKKPYIAAFKQSPENLKLDVARNKQKAMRNAIKDGKKAYERFITMNCVSGKLTGFADMHQVFDALEASDLFLPLRKSEKTMI